MCNCSQDATQDDIRSGDHPLDLPFPIRNAVQLSAAKNADHGSRRHFGGLRRLLDYTHDVNRRAKQANDPEPTVEDHNIESIDALYEYDEDPVLAVDGVTPYEKGEPSFTIGISQTEDDTTALHPALNTTHQYGHDDPLENDTSQQRIPDPKTSGIETEDMPTNARPTRFGATNLSARSIIFQQLYDLQTQNNILLDSTDAPQCQAYRVKAQIKRQRIALEQIVTMVQSQGAVIGLLAGRIARLEKWVLGDVAPGPAPYGRRGYGYEAGYYQRDTALRVDGDDTPGSNAKWHRFQRRNDVFPQHMPDEREDNGSTHVMFGSWDGFQRRNDVPRDVGGNVFTPYGVNNGTANTNHGVKIRPILRDTLNASAARQSTSANPPAPRSLISTNLPIAQSSASASLSTAGPSTKRYLRTGGPTNHGHSISESVREMQAEDRRRLQAQDASHVHPGASSAFIGRPGYGYSADAEDESSTGYHRLLPLGPLYKPRPVIDAEEQRYDALEGMALNEGSRRHGDGDGEGHTQRTGGVNVNPNTNKGTRHSLREKARFRAAVPVRGGRPTESIRFSPYPAPPSLIATAGIGSMPFVDIGDESGTGSGGSSGEKLYYSQRKGGQTGGSAGKGKAEAAENNDDSFA